MTGEGEGKTRCVVGETGVVKVRGRGQVVKVDKRREVKIE